MQHDVIFHNLGVFLEQKIISAGVISTVFKISGYRKFIHFSPPIRIIFLPFFLLKIINLIFSVLLINLHYVHLKDSAIVLYHHFQEIMCSKIARYWLNLGIPHECPLLKNNDLVLYYAGLCMLQLILYINYLLLVFLKPHNQ